jgi:hypothetical protein
MGWAYLDDGPLLDEMAEQFDVLVTVDKSFPNNSGSITALWRWSSCERRRIV